LKESLELDGRRVELEIVSGGKEDRLDPLPFFSVDSGIGTTLRCNGTNPLTVRKGLICSERMSRGKERRVASPSQR